MKNGERKEDEKGRGEERRKKRRKRGKEGKERRGRKTRCDRIRKNSKYIKM